ncbi:hypothetical protein H257_10365 [Aphanomyces astaci]|uniref:Uncharacterized protein n=1 Tax=Aphanomyces astaci TaxID=112090 RepID=W4G787_APHAT|nr:hypothetical protein H257_10365 [Aphanomyces astaci]ETV75136.1 hypothetical protein H257_10365 [Aphanomyces astaci]|eukprot:XP_009835184.1 hypothetical protein H257_10365 [Aphanomyces astaci]
MDVGQFLNKLRVRVVFSVEQVKGAPNAIFLRRRRRNGGQERLVRQAAQFPDAGDDVVGVLLLEPFRHGIHEMRQLTQRCFLEIHGLLECVVALVHIYVGRDVFQNDETKRVGVRKQVGDDGELVRLTDDG